MGSNPLRSQPRKSVIDDRRKFLPILHISLRQRGRLRLLRGRVERPARQLTQIERPVRHIPVNVVRRNEIQAPGLHPALPAAMNFLIGIGCVARRQRLEYMKNPPVPNGPRRKRNQRQQDANRRHAQQFFLCDRSEI